MKRAMIILMMIVTVLTGLFALTDTQRLIISTTVEGTAPVFAIFGSLDNSFETISSENGNLLSSGKDISREAIMVNFKLAQTNLAKNTKEYTLSISASPFSAKIDGIDHAGATPTISDFTACTISNGEKVTSSLNNTAHSVTLDYNGKVNPIDIATFSITWAQEEDFLPATYSADVTLTFTSK